MIWCYLGVLDTMTPFPFQVKKVEKFKFIKKLLRNSFSYTRTFQGTNKNQFSRQSVSGTHDGVLLGRFRCMELILCRLELCVYQWYME